MRYAVVRLIAICRCQTSSELSATGPLIANPPAMWTSASKRSPWFAAHVGDERGDGVGVR